MESFKTFTGNTADEIWQQLTVDINSNAEVFEYYALINQANHKIKLAIDIDLGGGFEGGMATTTFIAALPDHHDFRFALHEDDFIDDIGKFFGMQDVEIGYPEFDRRLVIKTNDETRTKSLFEDSKVRAVFERMENFDFGIRHHTANDSDIEQYFLELNIEDGITDPGELRLIYDAFFTVLVILENY